MPEAAPPPTEQLTDAQLEQFLSDGWRTSFERDPADSRFVILTCRHPYPLTEQCPAAAEGIAAQINTIAFAVTTCAGQGIVPGPIAMSIIRDLTAQLVAVRANGGKLPEQSRIVLPGQ